MTCSVSPRLGSAATCRDRNSRALVSLLNDALAALNALLLDWYATEYVSGRTPTFCFSANGWSFCWRAADNADLLAAFPRRNSANSPDASLAKKLERRLLVSRMTCS